MDGKKEILVGRGANHVGDGPKLPRPKRRRLEKVGADKLEENDAGDNVFGQGFGSAESRYLREDRSRCC